MQLPPDFLYGFLIDLVRFFHCMVPHLKVTFLFSLRRFDFFPFYRLPFLSVDGKLQSRFRERSLCPICIPYDPPPRRLCRSFYQKFSLKKVSISADTASSSSPLNSHSYFTAFFGSQTHDCHKLRCFCFFTAAADGDDRRK